MTTAAACQGELLFCQGELLFCQGLLLFCQGLLLFVRDYCYLLGTRIILSGRTAICQGLVRDDCNLSGTTTLCSNAPLHSFVLSQVINFSPGGPIVTSSNIETVILSMYQFGVGSNFWLLVIGDLVVFLFVVYFALWEVLTGIILYGLAVFLQCIWNIVLVVLVRGFLGSCT